MHQHQTTSFYLNIVIICWNQYLRLGLDSYSIMLNSNSMISLIIIFSSCLGSINSKKSLLFFQLRIFQKIILNINPIFSSFLTTYFSKNHNYKTFFFFKKLIIMELKHDLSSMLCRLIINPLSYATSKLVHQFSFFLKYEQENTHLNSHLIRWCIDNSFVNRNCSLGRRISWKKPNKG